MTHSLRRVIVLAIFSVSSVSFAQSPSSSAAPASQPQRDSGSSGAASGLAPDGTPLYKTIQENWASLSVKGSALHPESPIVGQVDENEKFTRTLVSLKWRPGDALDVYVVIPKKVKKPAAVLYLYGYGEDTDRFRDDRWCERVTNGGVAAVGFVSALTGQRFHDRPMQQWFVSELQESLGSTVHDVKFILDYLESRRDIDMNRIGMFGQGSGGTIAILAAAADPRIKAIDVLEPWGDWPVWLAKSPVIEADDPNKNLYTKREFQKKVAPLDPVKWLPKLKTTQIHITQIADGDSNPQECKDRLKAVAPKQARLDRYDSTPQMMTMLGGGRLFDWIKDEVRNPARDTSKKTVAANGSTARHTTQP